MTLIYFQILPITVTRVQMKLGLSEFTWMGKNESTNKMQINSAGGVNPPNGSSLENTATGRQVAHTAFLKTAFTVSNLQMAGGENLRESSHYIFFVNLISPM